MGIFRKIWAVSRINLQRWKNDLRVWVIFLITAVMIVRMLQHLTVYGLDAGMSCTAYLLPILFSGSSVSIGSTKMLLYVGALLLMCDAPFLYPTTPYMVLRSRRNCWWMGECLYIFMVSLIYTLFVVLVSMLVVLPVISFGEQWGGVIESFTYGSGITSVLELREKYGGLIWMPRETITYLYPLGAQLYTVFAMFASISILGMIAYLINLVSRHRVFGIIAAAVLIFVDPIVNLTTEMLPVEWIKMLSPITWASTDYLYVVDRTEVLTVPYVITMYIVLIVVLLLLIWRASKKVMIEVRGEV